MGHGKSVLIRLTDSTTGICHCKELFDMALTNKSRKAILVLFKKFSPF